MNLGKQLEADMATLVESPAFRRFLFRVVESAGICIPATKDDMSLRLEGKRALGLEILGWVDAALDRETPSTQRQFAALHLAIAEVLAPKEKRNDRRNHVPGFTDDDG